MWPSRNKRFPYLRTVVLFDVAAFEAADELAEFKPRVRIARCLASSTSSAKAPKLVYQTVLELILHTALDEVGLEAPLLLWRARVRPAARWGGSANWARVETKLGPWLVVILCNCLKR
jgi:hypothetical protein